MPLCFSPTSYVLCSLAVKLQNASNSHCNRVNSWTDNNARWTMTAIDRVHRSTSFCRARTSMQKIIGVMIVIKNKLLEKCQIYRKQVYSRELHKNDRTELNKQIHTSQKWTHFTPFTTFSQHLEFKVKSQNDRIRILMNKWQLLVKNSLPWSGLNFP